MLNYVASRHALRSSDSPVLRKLIQNHVPRFRFNSPSLVTQFSNAKEKDVEPVLKLEKGAQFISALCFSAKPNLIMFSHDGHHMGFSQSQSMEIPCRFQSRDSPRSKSSSSSSSTTLELHDRMRRPL